MELMNKIEADPPSFFYGLAVLADVLHAQAEPPKGAITNDSRN